MEETEEIFYGWIWKSEIMFFSLKSEAFSYTSPTFRCVFIYANVRLW